VYGGHKICAEEATPIYEIWIGSNSGSGPITVTSELCQLSCPATVNRDNWITGDEYPDLFSISTEELSNESGSWTSVSAVRLDDAGDGSQANIGWGMNLGFACTGVVCPEPTQRHRNLAVDQPVSVADWLEAANRNLRQYAAAFTAYGYEDSSVLAHAEKSELEEAFEEMGVKKPHRKLILRAAAALQQTSKSKTN